MILMKYKNQFSIMPNYWETSARPLFVKTVFVNGNRHAILFEEDPILRCGNSPFKKISRPNSSLSFASEFFFDCSESQDSIFETKASKLKNTGQQQSKDLSSELQSCLIKLKLASGNLKSKNKSEEKCFCDEGTSESKENKSPKLKQYKRNYEKICKKKHFNEGSKEYKLTGRKNSHEDCFVYNLENFKGKKNYCFVKISSQPPQFIFKCCCEESWNERHNNHSQNNHNFMISATIHNLIMPSAESDNPSGKKLNYILPFENAEMYWNNYLTKSYFNSLSEKVYQWLNLASKRTKQKEKLNSTDLEDTLSSTERIFSGKKFVEQIRKAECFFRQDNKRAESKDVETEVVGEPNVETLLSTDEFQECLSEKNLAARELPIEGRKLPNDENPSVTKSPSREINLFASPLKAQDMALNYHARENFTFRSKRKTRETRTPRQSKHKVDNSEGENNFIITTINSWERRFRKKGVFLHKSDGNTEQCQSSRSLEECGDKSKNPISSENFSPQNHKSINNINITRTGPVLVQNLLSPQQLDKMSYLREEEIVWESEKNTGKLQLHIFMPSILLRDQSDDSTSECETVP